jgi:hypothetical protein
MNTSKTALAVTIPGPDARKRTTVRFTASDLRLLASLEAPSGQHSIAGILRWAMMTAAKKANRRNSSR